MAEAKSFMLENLGPDQIKFRNFKGEEGMYNQRGYKTFSAVLPDEMAEAMLADEWNVKYLKPLEEGEPALPIIEIAARFDKYPPRVYLITETARTQLDESSIEILDYADIKSMDFIAQGSWWSNNGKQGWKAYLKTMFVTINEDPLERKYQIHDNPTGNG